MPLFLCCTADGSLAVFCSIRNGVRSSPSALQIIPLIGVSRNLFDGNVQGIINMPITFAPQLGQVLMCDFGPNSIPPEMSKVRHVVVLSPRRRTGSGWGSCIIVPFSTGAPSVVEPYHYRIPANKYRFFKRNTEVWAKGDMVAHVSFKRLDRVLCDGRFSSPSLDPEDFSAIQRLVWEAMGKPIIEDTKVVENVAEEEVI